ncbi:type II secretion system protein, partial [Aliarcobacter butzleri]|uniref:type II secretion system protein n=1 Tax=Aliarcobacter butzleri TaxID=28197 RepID=UPI0021B3FC8C
MKPAFSLLELIFAIVVLGIIVSVAVPKFLDTRDSALVSTIKRDVNTAINSIQSYYLLNQKIEKLTDAMEISDSNWKVEDLKLTDKNSCLHTPEPFGQPADLHPDTLPKLIRTVS